jgi:S-formylglutathione hydrolase FrmB
LLRAEIFCLGNAAAGPAAGNHAWPYWGAQLQALKPDLIATLNG